MNRKFTYIAMSAVLLAFALAARPGAYAATPSAVTPTVADFLALDKQAIEAYMRGDGKFFRILLTDNTVMTVGGHRISKAELIKGISGNRCHFKEGWSLSDPVLEKIDDDTYALGYTMHMEGDCTANHKTEKEPNPVRAATVWVRFGEKWQVAFHGENAIVDPKTLAESVKEEKAENAASPLSAVTDPGTAALMAADNAVWAAWKDKDATQLEKLTTANITFVDIFGDCFNNKADTIKDWTGSICDVKSFSLTNGAATFISPTVGILTLTGSMDGNCGGMKPPPVYGTTLYVKEGGAWKWAFGFNSPH